jgi:hypothetical protein
MKIEKMTKTQLLIAIENDNKKLNDPVWVRNTSRFMIGAIFVHRSKLLSTLKNRG